MSIMTIMSNYVTLLQICVFQTIISIILFCFCYVNYGNYVRLCTLLHLFVFQSIISIICFDFYYFNSFFYVILCQLCQLYSLDIIRISGIIAIIYHCSFQHPKVAYGARDWCYYPECIRRHTMQLLQQKYCQSLVVYAPPFLPTTP